MSCFISRAACPWYTQIPLASSTPALATIDGRVSDGGIHDKAALPTCDEITLPQPMPSFPPSPPSSPASCVDQPDSVVAGFFASAPMPIPNCIVAAQIICGTGAASICCASCAAQSAAPARPTWSKNQCVAESAAAKTYLEHTATFTLPNSTEEPYLMPCPRSSSPFSATDYEGWFAYQFTSKCESWCNAYTCFMSQCSTCAECAGGSLRNHCADWCNDWTSWSMYCDGCTASSAAQNRCYTEWCGVYTCGLTSFCSGCDVCVDLAAGAHCAGWCNSWTSTSGYCRGC